MITISPAARSPKPRHFGGGGNARGRRRSWRAYRRHLPYLQRVLDAATRSYRIRLGLPAEPDCLFWVPVAPNLPCDCPWHVIRRDEDGRDRCETCGPTRTYEGTP